MNPSIRLTISALAAAATLAACQAPGPVAPAPGATASIAPTATRVAARLTGQVLAPPGVISQNGANMVGPGSSMLIANNGAALVGKAKYGLRAVAQAPLAGAVVRVLDAAGRPVPGPDGAPLAAVADAEGRFAIDAPLPPGDLVLAADVRSAGGAEAEALRAVAPPAAGAREVRVDVASTLVAGFVVDDVVRGQPDPQATLDKLDDALAAETRAAAERALADAGVGVADLSARGVLAAVDTLRRASPAFAAQLDAVRRKLVAAGQLDLGNGRPATSVALGYLSALAPAPDGTLWIACGLDRRLWALRADGTLATVAGSGTPAAQVAGVPAPLAGLLLLEGFDRDDAGRPVFLERDLYAAPDARVRLSRQAADGRIEVLWEAPLADRDPKVVAAGPGDAFHMILLTDDDEARLWRWRPGRPPLALAALGPEDSARVARSYGSGRDARGRLYLAVSGGGEGTAVWRLDPAATKPALELVVTNHQADLRGVTVDGAGNVFRLYLGTQRLTVTPPDGAERTVLAAAPPWFKLVAEAAAMMPDGTIYLGQAPDDGYSTGSRVYKVAGDGLELVAGLAPSAGAGGVATETAFEAPAGLVALPDGDVLVADADRDRIFRLGADGNVAPYLGTGTAGHADGPAATATLDGPEALHLDGAGALYVRELGSAYRIRRLGPDGRVTTLVEAAGAAPWIGDLAVTPAGTVYHVVADLAARPTRHEIRAIEPGGAARLVAAMPGKPYLAVDPAGRLHYAVDGVVYRHERAGVDPVVVSTDRRVEGMYAITFDPRGRLYGLDRSSVYAFDAAGAVSVLAGEGGRHFDRPGTEGSLEYPYQLAFPANGDLLIADNGHRQVKRIPAGEY